MKISYITTINNKLFISFFTFLLIFTFSPFNLIAGTRTASVSGNWSSKVTWGGANVPVSSDDVFINTGVTVTIDIPTAQCATLTMNRPSTGSTNTLNINNNTLNTGTLTLSATTSPRNNNINITTGTLNITVGFNSGTTGCFINITDAGTLNFGGFVSTAPILTLVPTSTVNYSRGGTQTIIIATYGNLICSGGSGNKTFAGSCDVVNTFTINNGNKAIMNNNNLISRTFTINNLNISAGSIDNSSSTLTGIATNIDITNSYIQTGGTVYTSGSGFAQMTFTGGGNTTYSNIYTSAVNNWKKEQILVSNNTTLTLNSDLMLWGLSAGSTSLTIDAGSTLIAGSNLIKNGDATVPVWTVNGTLKTANINGFSGTASSTCSSTGNPNIILGNASNIEYNGTLNQVLTPRTDYADLTLNNNAGLTLANNLIINRTGIFNDGIVSYTGTGLINFGSNASSNEGNSNSFINGIVSKSGTSAFTFPIGEISGGNIVWAPISIEASTANSDITAKYNFSAPINNSNSLFMCDVNVLNYVSGVEHWDITSTNSTPAITLFWKNGSRSNITSVSDLLVANWNGTCWESKGATGQTGTTTSGSITSNLPFASFNIVTFGSSANPLPISLISFSAHCQGNNINLHWSTASETNNDFFTVERSKDGKTFEVVNTVKGAGNSNTVINYSYVNKNSVSSINYYRLKQTDFDGKFSYSEIRSVKCSENNTTVSYFPNPFSSEININIKNFVSENAVIEIIDIMGKVILSQKIENNEYKLNTSDIKPGVYFVKLTSENFNDVSKLIKN
ncbi:MAG: T9SS type A sorting domain-containing protein [Bacteroidetes bacterium]|nr:T9SS type A sorting domain-containing protein [Bacteroidota bacterium]